MRGPKAGAGRTPITNVITWTGYQEKFFHDVNDPEAPDKEADAQGPHLKGPQGPPTPSF